MRFSTTNIGKEPSTASVKRGEASTASVKRGEASTASVKRGEALHVFVLLFLFKELMLLVVYVGLLLECEAALGVCVCVL